MSKPNSGDIKGKINIFKIKFLKTWLLQATIPFLMAFYYQHYIKTAYTLNKT